MGLLLLRSTLSKDRSRDRINNNGGHNTANDPAKLKVSPETAQDFHLEGLTKVQSPMANYKGKNIVMEDDDEPIQLPEQDNLNLIQEYGLSLIGRVLNPKKQDVEKLIGFMPQHWGLEDRITAMDLVRWEPIVHDDYPWEMTFWTQLSGIPLHLWTETNLRSIGDKLGHIHEVNVDEGKLLLSIDSRKPLKFTRKIRCHNGDEATIQIKYDRLFKFCSHCGFMTHEVQSCPIKEEEINAQRQSTRQGIFSRLQAGPSQTNTHSERHLERQEERHSERNKGTPRSSYNEEERIPNRNMLVRQANRSSSYPKDNGRREELVHRSRHSSRENRGGTSYHRESNHRGTYPKDNRLSHGVPYRRKEQEDHRSSWIKRNQTRPEENREGIIKEGHQIEEKRPEQIRNPKEKRHNLLRATFPKRHPS
ncbi:unnamed protein product [Microthlaspi erraticum]|uniref:Zinc knuckle CX2CX4HX4C domain-containing protein n=1 Tax=Microthlaspi erraticum TaxID=1685480 RepID=A0A6D2JEA5_9BRAS|nr:unnamed protein product [Microthlaspi erraticum]